jgi:hypothetical protein
MYEKIFHQLAEMAKDKADFNEYFNALIEIIENTNDNDRVILMYMLLENVRKLGVAEGEQNIKQKLFNLLQTS